MSYCRFSSDDYQSDVYAYEDCEYGFVVHVARARFNFKEPIPPRVSVVEGHEKEFHERYKKISSMCDAADRVKIGLPYDGKRFFESDLTSLKNRLLQLSSAGYRIPDSAFEAIEQELIEEHKKQ